MCFYPITLKSGEVVPCGHCEECYSQRRNEWSVRLQLHTLSYDRMPLFVTLTYAPEFYPDSDLDRKHVQDFIKRIRDKYDLYNTNFSFFGCGERGDTFGRGHYHLLLFGMPVYEELYSVDDELCREVIEKDWKFGQCFVCVADWSGIHYVTKYCLKHLEKVYDSSFVPPFTICSKYIGKGFCDTDQFKYIQRCVNLDRYRQILDECGQVDYTNAHTIKSTTSELISRLQPFVESVNIVLPSGKRVKLPRYYRKKLYGSFQHWSDNPFAFYRYLQRMNRYADQVINGARPQDRILVKKQQISKRMYQKGHLVVPKKYFNVK